MEQSTELVPRLPAPGPALVPELGLHLLPDIGRDDGRLLAVVEFVLVVDLADVGDPGQQPVQVGFGEGSAPANLPVAGSPAFGPPAPALQFPNHRQQPAQLEVEREDGPDPSRLLCINDQPSRDRSRS